jgi:predicted kinase
MKIHMMAGLPASGKSTVARKIVKQNGNAARVNRDDLRAMLFNSEWSGKREKVVIAVEKAIAKVLLDYNLDAIIDDTNLSEKHEDMWANLAADLGVPFKKEFLNVDMEECIRRDANRDKPVGRNVIVKMAAKNGLIQWPDKGIVLVDIDGTLSLSTGREKYLAREVKDWQTYFSLLHTDVPAINIFKRVKELSDSGHTIVIVSGRGAEWEDDTLKWFDNVWTPSPFFPELEVPKFPIFQFFFRNAGDHRPDEIIKREVLDLLPRKPALVIDDRPKVCRMWEEQGLNVYWARGRDIEEF